MRTMDPLNDQTRTTVSWSRVWLTALAKPSVREYERLVSQPAVSAGTAAVWVLLASTIIFVVGLTLSFILSGYGPLAEQSPSAGSSPFGYGVLVLCLAPIGDVFSVFGLFLTAGISHVMARSLGGVGKFSQLAYAIAAYTSPLYLITVPLNLNPYLACHALPIGLYSIFLNVVSIKAVHRFSWGRSIVSSVLVVALFMTLISCLAIAFLTMLGPAIGEAFQGILGSIGTSAQ